MANIDHSSHIKLKHHNDHVKIQDNSDTEKYDLIVVSEAGIAIQNAISQTPLRRWHNVHSSAIALASENARIFIAHNGRILSYDTARGRSTTYKLRGNDVEVRCVVAIPHSQEFLFWIKGSNIIRGISCASNSLTSFSCVHPNEPICLAVSRNAKFVISCSRRPATVYLQDIGKPRSQIPLRLRTTRSHVIVTAFHPERSTIFLLAHDDGTVAIHDARRVLELRKTGTRTDGLVRHVSALHHHRIIAAAFLPGHKMRVVSLGSHGKCRITDYENTVTMIVAWDVGQQCSTLSAFSSSNFPLDTRQKGPSSDDTVQVKSRAPHMPKNDTVIAIGLEDGSVRIYNSIGLLEQDTSATGDAVVGLHYVPAAIVDRFKLQHPAMDLIDINWPPVTTKSSSQESSKTLLMKENLRLSAKIAEIELPPRSKQISRSLLEKSSPRGPAFPNSVVIKKDKAVTPPRTPKRSPPRAFKITKRPSSQPNLLASLRRRRQEVGGTLLATPPRKNLHDEPPGSSPREAQYVPGSSKITPMKGGPETQLTPSILRHNQHGEPTEFEAHLLNAPLLATEQSKEKKNSQQSPGHRLSESLFFGSPPLNDFEARPLKSIPSSQERQSQNEQHAGHQSPTVSAPKPLSIARKRPKLERSRCEVNEGLMKGTVDATVHHSSLDQGHLQYRHAQTTTPRPMPGQYPASPTVTTDDGATIYEDAEEPGSQEPWRHQHEAPVSDDSGEHRCLAKSNGCGCADIVREEMALVRAEVASLRKTVWVLAAGLGVDEREVARRILCGSVEKADD